MKVITLKDFDSELHRSIKIQAAKEGITIKALIHKALTQYLERVEAEEKRGKR